MNFRSVHLELILLMGMVTRPEEIAQEEDSVTMVVELAIVSLASMVLVVSIRPR